VGVVVDVADASVAVAGLVATGGTKEPGAATGGVTQNIRAGRDVYASGRDSTVTNYRRPGE
jgi:hypothetical protein